MYTTAIILLTPVCAVYPFPGQTTILSINGETWLHTHILHARQGKLLPADDSQALHFPSIRACTAGPQRLRDLVKLCLVSAPLGLWGRPPWIRACLCRGDQYRIVCNQIDG